MMMSNSEKLSPERFKRLMRRAESAALIERNLSTNPTFALDRPTELGVKLNNACNLRCSHCYEWNADGFHHQMEQGQKNAEMSLELIGKLLSFTEETRAPLYLWGGEPLIYSKFKDLLLLIGEHKRWTTICTNGTLIEKFTDSIIKVSENLAFLVSVEGLQEANDNIRGAGTFEKVVRGLKHLLDLRRSGAYRGAISVSLTLNDLVLESLIDFLQFFDNLGLDSIYLVFPWFIAPSVGREMDAFAETAFPTYLPIHGCGSWHSFTFKISPDNIDVMKTVVADIRSRTWKSLVRFHPHLSADEIEDFILGSNKPAENKKTCYSIRKRMDVLPNGDVVSCKFFPESKVGNLEARSPLQIWRNDQYTEFRRCIAGRLSPVCSKCGLLYTSG